jgi:hypothetical protein
VLGRDGRVIDSCMCSLGERAGGVEGRKGVGGVVLRGEDARGKAAVVLYRATKAWYRASAGPVALSGGIGAVRWRRGGVGR